MPPLAIVAVAACGLVGCGRIGFDAVSGDGGGDDAAATAAISLDLPGGGTIHKLTSGPDGAWYAVAAGGQGYRSDDGQRWTRCGSRALTAIAVATDNTVYGSGAQVGISSDRSASWTTSVIDRFTDDIGAYGNEIFALADIGLRRRTGATWAPVPTPFDGNRFLAHEGRPGTRHVIAVANTGLLVSADGTTWTPITAGLPNLAFDAVAASPTRLYTITGADVPAGGIAASTDGTGATWTTQNNAAGLAIAVDPLNDLHVVAGVYDNLGETTNGFMTMNLNLRASVGLDAANIYDLHYLPNGDLLSASTRGVFFSPTGPLAFQERSEGLDAWNVFSILRDGDDTYVATEGGVLHASTGAAYTISTAGMQFSTRVRTLIAAPDGSLISAGRSILRSVDRGATWLPLNLLGQQDNYDANALAFAGTRLYAGTYQRLIYAEPPYTTWTPVVVGGANRIVYGIAIVGTEIWLATSSGLFVSNDQAASFTPIAGIATTCRALHVRDDGSLVAGCANGAWWSDPARTAWERRGLVGNAVRSLLAVDTTLIAATAAGVHATTDLGASWTLLAGSAGVDTWTLALDPGDGSIVYGGTGIGLERTVRP